MSGERTEPRWPVTVLVPTRNERGNIESLLERMPLVELVIFVDDSDDDTPAVIEREAQRSANPVQLVHRPRGARGGGLAGAVTVGLEAVTSAWVCVMDGDLQHPPEVVARLMERTTDGDVDLVVASRRNWESINEGLGPVRRLVSWVFGRAAFALFGSRLSSVRDPLSGFFVVRTKSLDTGLLKATGFKILLEILITHTELRPAEVGFAFARRGSGESNGSPREAVRYVRHVLRLRRRATAAGRPLGSASGHEVAGPGQHGQPDQGGGARRQDQPLHPA
jgi:dolichol-phosphate mannosyltransferase